MSAESLSETIRLPDWPFDLAATLGSGQVFHWHEGEEGFAGLIGEEPVRVAVAGEWTLRCSPGMAEKVQRYFGLDHNLGSIMGTFPQEDTVMARALFWCPGLRIIRQQTNWFAHDSLQTHHARWPYFAACRRRDA